MSSEHSLFAAQELWEEKRQAPHESAVLRVSSAWLHELRFRARPSPVYGTRNANREGGLLFKLNLRTETV